MSWYKKLIPARINRHAGGRKKIPAGLWSRCKQCESVLYRPELERMLWVCSQCHYHFPISARRRLDIFLDPGDRFEIGAEISPVDFLKFKDRQRYKERLKKAQAASGEKDALVVMAAKLHRQPVIAAAFEFGFIGGSMGSVVGERFRLAVEHCCTNNEPLVCFCMSGGARMQEALISLMQMAKVSVALGQLSQQRLPFIAVLLNPTMGGVSASLAMLGDIIIAEPGALIGFAGPRVIEQTVRQKLPSGFQRSEFLLEHGAIDMIVPRQHLRARIANILSLLS